MSWRGITDWAKQRPSMLRLADRLGRGTGRFRVLDHFGQIPAATLTPDLSKWNDHALAAAWIGHATVLIRIGGKTVLTDPVFSNRVGIGLGLATGGPRRLIAPALSLNQLPSVDLILISHAHFDHLDRPTLRHLPKHIQIITAWNTSDLLLDLGFKNVSELRWNESKSIEGLSVQALRVSHWGARTFYDHQRGYNGYLIESADRRVLYGGDTAYQDEFKSIGGVDLAIVGVGAYDPYIRAHANPEQAWEMAMKFARAERVLPIHHSTFRLSYEPTKEPIQRFLTAAGDQAERVIIRDVGGDWSLP
ncbi:MAG: MBL fold metallo-hydrolase [Phycisphaerae bacterium]|nr:MBL fold metallo-hydrolase [Phycisphaerae bacterium]